MASLQETIRRAFRSARRHSGRRAGTRQDGSRIVVTPLSEGLTRVELRFGFMEEPNVPEALAVAMARGLIATFDLTRVIYYTGHETIIPSGRRPGLPRWREALFA
jgi:KUP system potassium uptake protein